MAKPTYVPVNPRVLEWAVRESGLSFRDVAERTKISESELGEYLSGEREPNLTNFGRLCNLLKRPSAVFFLPEAPGSTLPNMEFRHSPETARNKLNYKEMLQIRMSNRQRGFLSWINKELRERKFKLERFDVGSRPEDVANRVRRSFDLSIDEQVNCDTASAFFKLLRSKFESFGIYVFLLSLGKDSIRGFSIWDDYAPVIGINTTGWNPESRIFTLLHELGHLLVRSSSACSYRSEAYLESDYDSQEKWVDGFSAAFLLPADRLKSFLEMEHGFSSGGLIEDLSVAGSVKDRFKISLTAAVMRFIELRISDWSLYEKLRNLKTASRTQGGGKPRDRLARQRHIFGDKTFDTVIKAVNEEIIDKTDVLSYLDINIEDFDRVGANTH